MIGENATKIDVGRLSLPFQSDGARFLAARRRALLCDEMGLGKTIQAISACDLVAAKNILVLAPASVTVNWAREFTRWQSTLRSTGGWNVATGCRTDVVILSYDKARDPAVLNWLLTQRWDALICDEAHYLKEPRAARSQCVLGPAGDGIGGLVSVAGYAWGLTGTPMPNSADELWALLCAFGPGAIWDSATGRPLSFHAWRKRFCTTLFDPERGVKVVGVRMVGELKARLSDVMIRRKKLEVMKDLPPIREGEILLSAEKHLKELGSLEVGEVGAMLRRAAAATLLLTDVGSYVERMLEDASEDSFSRLRRVTASIKARVLAPMLADEMTQREGKLVVMGWHKDTLDVLHGALAPFGAVRVDGSVSSTTRRDGGNDRQDAVDAFQNDPATRVFVGQIQAAGTGLTLTAAADLVFAEMSLVPGDNAQAAMRVHRVGQTQPVLIRYATLADTIDEAVIRILRRKTRDINAVLN